MSAIPQWLSAARSRGDQPPDALRAPLVAGASIIGSIEPGLAARLVDAGLARPGASGAWRIDEPIDASLAAIAVWLHRAGLAGPWRDERLSVADGDGRVVASVERAAVRALGIATMAVHLVGVGAGGAVWVQQRSLTKATDPGFWDTTMGGQVAHGESIETTLRRETLEEAGLDVDSLADLRRCADVDIRRPVPEGYMVERIAVFRASLSDGQRPVNRDGEVERFECLDASSLRRRLELGEFTLEASLILGAHLERHAGVSRP